MPGPHAEKLLTAAIAAALISGCSFSNNTPPSGSWTEGAVLVGFLGQEESHFGENLALSSTYTAVTSRADRASATPTSQVYVYKRNGDDHDLASVVDVGDDLPGAKCRSIAIDGATLAAACVQGEGADEQWALLVYDLGTEEIRLVRSVVQAAEVGRFGSDIRFAEDQILVSIRGCGPEAVGSVFVYSASKTEAWSRSQILRLPNDNRGLLFGHAMAVSGDNLAVAEVVDVTTLFQGSEVEHGGRVHCYKREPDQQWVLDQTIEGDPHSGAFGQAVVISENNLFIGSLSSDLTASTKTQAALHIFSRTGETWRKDQSITAPNHQPVSLLLAQAGDDVVFVASDLPAFGSSGTNGCVAVYSNSGDEWWVSSQLVNAELAGAVAIAAHGDVVLLTTHNLTTSWAKSKGRVHIFRRKVEHEALLDG